MTIPARIPPGGAWDPRRAADEALARIPFLPADARILDVEFVATTFVIAPHGLGRRYVGGFEIGRSDSNASLAVMLPSYDGLTFDPAREVVLITNAVATATFRIWLF